MEPLLRIGPIVQVALTVDDLDLSIGFYQRLGFPILFRTPQMAMLACGSTRLLLGTREAGQPSQPSFLYFQVDEIERAYATLVAAKIRGRDPPHMVGRFEGKEVWLATFFDPSGTLHHLISEVPQRSA